jgi:hypothetical protein
MVPVVGRAIPVHGFGGFRGTGAGSDDRHRHTDLHLAGIDGKRLPLGVAGEIGLVDRGERPGLDGGCILGGVRVAVNGGEARCLTGDVRRFLVLEDRHAAVAQGQDQGEDHRQDEGGLDSRGASTAVPK